MRHCLSKFCLCIYSASCVILGGPLWCSHAVRKASSLVKIDKSIGVEMAAQITINPCTAYRMLVDFVDLEPGEGGFEAWVGGGGLFFYFAPDLGAFFTSWFPFCLCRYVQFIV